MSFSTLAVRCLYVCPVVPGGVILCLLDGSSQMNVPGLVPLCLTALFIYTNRDKFYGLQLWNIVLIDLSRDAGTEPFVLTTIACLFIEAFISTSFEHFGSARARRMCSVVCSSSAVLPWKALFFLTPPPRSFRPQAIYFT